MESKKKLVVNEKLLAGLNKKAEEGKSHFSKVPELGKQMISFLHTDFVSMQDSFFGKVAKFRLLEKQAKQLGRDKVLAAYIKKENEAIIAWKQFFTDFQKFQLAELDAIEKNTTPAPAPTPVLQENNAE